MSFVVLRMQTSLRSLEETKLCVEGIVNSSTPDYAIPFEMVVENYNDITDETYSSVVSVSSNFYEGLIEKYGITPLLQGIKLDSVSEILDVFDSEAETNKLFHKEVEKIAYSVVAQFEKDTLFNNYNPGKIREYIENKILDLKEKFNIQPK